MTHPCFERLDQLDWLIKSNNNLKVDLGLQICISGIKYISNVSKTWLMHIKQDCHIIMNPIVDTSSQAQDITCYPQYKHFNSSITSVPEKVSAFYLWRIKNNLSVCQ